MIDYERPRGSIHDLAHLGELNACRDRILCVSDRTLYLLHNYSVSDCTFSARYAVELLESGYVPVGPEDGALWELYQEVVLNFQLEVLDMTCDIESGLVAIADAIAATGGGGGCGGCGTSTQLPCIVGESNEVILGPGDSFIGNPANDPPPDGFATWEEYNLYKCQAANFIWSLERKHMVNLRNFELVTLTADLVGPAVAGLAGILPASLTPAGFVVLVSSIIAIGVVAGASWFYMDEMIDEWDANKDDIICSLFNSGNSVEAVSALSNALEDAIQAILTWGSLEPVADAIAGLLGTVFSQLAGNGIIEPLFKAVVSVTQYESDCSSCDDPTFKSWIKTNTIKPYDLLQIGDSYTATCHDEDKFTGSGACGDPRFYFTYSGVLTDFYMKWEVRSDDGGALNWSIYRTADDDFQTTFTTHAGTAIWTEYTEHAAVSLSPGVGYYLLTTHQPGHVVEFRKLHLWST